jgi:hypothetical protein
LVWTIRAPSSVVDVDLDAGTARFRMANVAMQDYGTLFNALFGGGGPGLPGPGRPSVVSWDLTFGGVRSRRKIRDADVGFAGEFLETGAHIDWSMTEAGFSFRSDAGGQTVVAAVLGHERNGSFFPQPA